MAWIDGVPAFAGPGASLAADASGSSDADGAISSYAWNLSGPCAATGPTNAATLGFSIDANAPVAYPSTPCQLQLRVMDGDGVADSAEFEVIVLPKAYELAMQEAYIAYYGRPADGVGLHYWGASLYQENGDLEALISAYGTSVEYTSRYGALADDALINVLYQNMFGRDTDAVGRQWYVDNRLVPYREQWTQSIRQAPYCCCRQRA